MTNRAMTYSYALITIIVASTILTIEGSHSRRVLADDCPLDVFPRAGLPASDRRITVDSIDFPELAQGESGSISVDFNEEYLVGWQSVNPDLSPDNDIFVSREDDHDGDDTPNNDCPLPLTLAQDGAFHSHTSVAIGLRLPPGEIPEQHFLVSWTSQFLSPAQAPSLRKLDSSHFLLHPDDTPFIHSFSVAGFTDLPILSAGGNLDVGPSSGVSDTSDVVSLSDSLRIDVQKGLIYELEATGATIERVRCCNDPFICPSES